MVLGAVTDFITKHFTDFVGDQGLYAVFVLMLIDAVLPAASELVMVYGGALAAGAFAGNNVVLFGREIDSGAGAYVAIGLAGSIGYLIGSILGWAIGLYGGRPLLERRGRWFHLSPERLDRAERWFDRHGEWAVFLGRITPVVRSFVSIPAGVFRAPLGLYTLLTLVGSALWAFAFAGIGYGFGEGYERFHEKFHYVDYAVLALIVGGVAWLIVRRLARRDLDPSR